MTKISNYVRPGSSGLVYPSTPGSSSTVSSVTDGSTTVVPANTIDFTSGATVSDLGSGVAGIAVTGGMANPMTTEGDLIYEHSGVPARLPIGSNTYVLTSNGTDPAWAAAGAASSPLTTKGDLWGYSTTNARVPIGSNTYVLTADSTQTLGLKWAAPAASGGGALVLLEQHDASSSATLDFTTCISSTYDDYIFELIHLLPVTNSDGGLMMRMGTGAGPSWDAGANYQWSHMYVYPTSSGVEGGGTTNQIYLTGNQVSSAHVGAEGMVHLFAPAGSDYTAVTADVMRFHVSLGAIIRDTGSGQYNVTTAVTGIRFLFTGSSIASGTIRAYGIAKS